MYRRTPEVPELATAPAGAGEPFVVVQVRVHRLRRARQPGGDGGVDDPAAGPVEPRLERAGLGAEVGLPERDAGDPGVVAISYAASTPAADSSRQWTGRPMNGTSSGPATFGA